MSEEVSLKLYRVTIEHEIWVVAENEYDAESLATRAMRDEIDNMDIWPEKVTSYTPMDADWADSIPYGDHETDDTVATWRKKLGVEYATPGDTKIAAASTVLSDEEIMKQFLRSEVEKKL